MALCDLGDSAFRLESGISSPLDRHPSLISLRGLQSPDLLKKLRLCPDFSSTILESFVESLRVEAFWAEKLESTCAPLWIATTSLRKSRDDDKKYSFLESSFLLAVLFSVIASGVCTAWQSIVFVVAKMGVSLESAFCNVCISCAVFSKVDSRGLVYFCMDCHALRSKARNDRK